jgi:Zn-dependent M16 (insulinase) family peptidase
MPSKKEMEAYTTQELERLERQRSSLESQGLAVKAEELSAALEHNDRQAPVDLIMSVPIPDINSISYHSIQRYCNRGESSGCSSFPGDLERIPVRFQLDDVKTQFVYLYALMDTSLVSNEQRLFLPLLMSCLPESAVMRNGQLIPYE